MSRETAKELIGLILRSDDDNEKKLRFISDIIDLLEKEKEYIHVPYQPITNPWTIPQPYYPMPVWYETPSVPIQRPYEVTCDAGKTAGNPTPPCFTSGGITGSARSSVTDNGEINKSHRRMDSNLMQ